MDLKAFGSYAQASRYAGTWIPVALTKGPHTAIATVALVRITDKAAVMENFGHPVDFDGARPFVSTDGRGHVVERELQPFGVEAGGEYRPFVVEVQRKQEPSWLEPIQAFLLYWGAWAEHGPGENISWRRLHGDDDPEEIARWKVDGVGDAELRVLEVRRDRLLPFLAAFDYDLVINLIADNYEVKGAHGDVYSDECPGLSLMAQCCNIDLLNGPPRLQTRLFTVALIERPAYDEQQQPWSSPEHPPLPFLIGKDPNTGAKLYVSHDGEARYLTHLFFRPSVLEHYYNDSEKYEVTPEYVSSKFSGWRLVVARTAAGNIHAYLGDIACLPLEAQQHWQSHSTLDEGGIPEDRWKRDFLAECASPPLDDIGELHAAIAGADEAAIAFAGVPLYRRPLDPTHRPEIEGLRIPTNDSLGAFKNQLAPLALLLVDHLSSDFLTSATAPAAHGTLSRLALLVGRLAKKDEPAARDFIGGLIAVQALRSNVGAHTTGREAEKALSKASIQKGHYRKGFQDLVQRATKALRDLEALLRESKPASDERQ